MHIAVAHVLMFAVAAAFSCSCKVGLVDAIPLCSNMDLSESGAASSDESCKSLKSCNSNYSRASKRTTATRSSRRSSAAGSSAGKNKVKKKSKRKALEEFVVQNCDSCGVVSTTLDPLREHERLTKAELPQITYRWGRGDAPKSGRVKKGSCYYCKRTHRAKKKYSAMKVQALKEWMDEDPENKKGFIDDKEKVMQILKDKGDDCRIFPNDFDKVVIVKKKESYGERTSCPGIKMSLTLFNSTYTEEERKKLHTKTEEATDPATGKSDTIVRIFDLPIGAERFDIYRDDGVEKQSEVGDSRVGSSKDAEEHWRSVAEGIYNPADRSKALSTADIRAPVFVSKEEAANKRKRQLIRNDTATSTCSRASSSSAPLSKAAKKLATSLKEKKQAKKKPKPQTPEKNQQEFFDAAGSCRWQLDSPSAKPLQLFVGRIRKSLVESEGLITQMKGWTKTDSVKDAAFLEPIRKMSGFQQKIDENGLTYCKGAVSTQLSRLRGGHELVKACKAFEQKIAGAEVTPRHRQLMVQAADMFSVNAACKDITVPWCITSFTHLAKYEYDFGRPQHPFDAFPEATCKLILNS